MRINKTRLTDLVMLLGVIGAVGCAPSHPESYRPAAIRQRIVAALPPDWTVVEPTDDMRLYPLKAYYDQPSTDTLVLAGPRRESLYWIDRDGGRHEEKESWREAVYLWIVPPGTPPYLTLNPKVAPAGPRCIYASAAGKVYGDASGFVTDPARWKQVLSQEGVGTPGSDPVPLSWRRWRRDIRESMGPKPEGP